MTSAPFELDPTVLHSKVAVITGASRGLGAGMARRFAQHGLRLGLCAQTTPDLAEAEVTASVDVTDAEAVNAFAATVTSRLGPIDIWINNAGVLDPMGPQRHHDPDQVMRALAVNIGGVANGTRAFTRSSPSGVDPARRKVLINVSSGAATSIYQGWSIYGATKAAVDHFTEIVAAEEPDVICHSVAPGVVDTDMQTQIRTHDETTFPAIARFQEMHRDGEWNSTDWVADHLLAILVGTLVPDSVVYRVPKEPRPEMGIPALSL